MDMAVDPDTNKYRQARYGRSLRMGGKCLIVAAILAAVFMGCDTDPLRIGPDDTNPIDRMETNLIIFDNARGVIDQLPRVSPKSTR